MILKLLKYVWRSVSRNRVRSLLTVAGIATAMFLFCFIEGLQTGVRAATESEATKNILIVYQKNRFCPAASSLPERYGNEIAKMPGVKSVLPIEIYVNNCRAALDSVTFRGVPPDQLVNGEKKVELVAGTIAEFAARQDAALVGQRLASRRNLKIGDSFQIGSVITVVTGIFNSALPGEDNLAYAHLEMLQRVQGESAIGRVTQFEVQIDDAKKADAIIAKIDDMFRADDIQTNTKTHKQFVSAATGDLLSLVRFTRFLGFLCVLVVLALTGNTVYVMVQDRIKEHAVLQTLGFRASHLFTMVIGESLILAVSGGVLGTLAATAILKLGHLGMGAEGVTISFMLAPAVVAAGLAASVITGVLAGFIPALQAAFAPIVDSLRRV